MANPTSAIFQTILAQANAATAALRFQNAFVRRIYWDHQPIVGIPYQTLTIVIPTVNQGAVVDIGSGPIQPVDYAYGTASITLDHNFSVTNVFKDFDQVRSARRLRDFFMVNFEALMRTINQQIVSKLNATNFPTYSLFTGTGSVANQIIRADIATAWTNLAKAGVPLNDNRNVSLIEQAETYGQMLADTNFTQQYIVGEEAARAIQQRAVLQTVYGAEIYYDQQLLPYNSGHAAAALMHRYAIAGVSAESPESGPNVEETTVYLGTEDDGLMPGSGQQPGMGAGEGTGIPVRIQASYSQNDQGWVVSMNALCGIKVVRPEMASLFQSAS